MPPNARGRPLKFGRPSRLIALTLPEDVISALQQIDPDIARAVVALVARQQPPKQRQSSALVDFAQVGRRQALIVVARNAIKALPGCTFIAFSREKAFLALDQGRGLADLELAVIDRLADGDSAGAERDALLALRRALQECRTKQNVNVQSRSILVVERPTGGRHA